VYFSELITTYLTLVCLLVLGWAPAQIVTMRAVALVSGGKDSTMNMMRCVEHGHSIVALANLYRKSPLHVSLQLPCTELPISSRFNTKKSS
jgi:hypothetical protein